MFQVFDVVGIDAFVHTFALFYALHGFLFVVEQHMGRFPGKTCFKSLCPVGLCRKIVFLAVGEIAFCLVKERVGFGVELQRYLVCSGFQQAVMRTFFFGKH